MPANCHTTITAEETPNLLLFSDFLFSYHPEAFFGMYCSRKGKCPFIIVIILIYLILQPFFDVLGTQLQHRQDRTLATMGLRHGSGAAALLAILVCVLCVASMGRADVSR